MRLRFLLARLHIDSLMSQPSLGHIKRALKNLPQGMKGLDETYNQAMKRIEGQEEASANCNGSPGRPRAPRAVGPVGPVGPMYPATGLSAPSTSTGLAPGSFSNFCWPRALLATSAAQGSFSILY